MKLFKKVICCLSFVSLISTATIAQDKSASQGDFTIGAGIVSHTFSQDDELRKSTGTKTYDGDDDEIKTVGGGQVYIEGMLSDELALGYKYQAMSGGYEYTNTLGPDFERKVEITNHIIYANVSVGLDSESYWRLGATLGGGTSQYKYKIDFKEESFGGQKLNDIEKTSKGTIGIAGLFFDWGADGFGGRIGYTYASTSYEKIKGDNGDEATPKGNGGQFNIDIRYTF